MAGEEESPGGSRIYRHEPREREPELTGGDAVLIEALSDHLAAQFGAEGTVFHEIVSDLVHVDIHVVPPGDDRPWITLVTSGMAERPMTVPDELDDHRYAELILALPPEWPLTEASFEDEANYWPIRLLKELARLPHEFDTFLYRGHTVPNGDPPEPYAAGTGLCCALIAPPLLTSPELDKLELPDGRVIHFYSVVLLHRDEMELKLQRGYEALIPLFEEHEVSELVDLSRPSVVPQRRGFFRRRG